MRRHNDPWRSILSQLEEKVIVEPGFLVTCNDPRIFKPVCANLLYPCPSGQAVVLSVFRNSILVPLWGNQQTKIPFGLLQNHASVYT